MVSISEHGVGFLERRSARELDDRRRQLVGPDVSEIERENIKRLSKKIGMTRKGKKGENKKGTKRK